MPTCQKVRYPCLDKKKKLLFLGGFFIFTLLGCTVTNCVSPSFAAAIETTLSDMDFTQLSIDELMEIEVMVTSFAKKPQSLFHTPSAGYVLTSDDIRRSGATTLPDLLRMVPGVQVARINANKWAISTRGFNNRFASKLLVMIDGRSVYSPLFSGVYWDVQDTMVEDIERVEVIRGPGGSLWGTNAVNGIINVITKHSEDTQGGLMTVGAGNEERAFGSIRYGGNVSEKGHYRLYAKYFDREEGWDPDALQENNHWQSGRAGFRTDISISQESEILFQGDYYHQHSDELLLVPRLTPPFSLSISDELDAYGGHLLTRWHHRFSKESDLSFQVYYDYTSRENPRLMESRHTLDFDFQHRFRPHWRHEIVWGLGYRCSWDNLAPTPFFEFDPRRSALQMPSAFVQDAISLIPEYLVLSLGTKMEYNDYTGIEWQPSAQLLVMPTEKHAIWMAVTRAVRTPDRIESDSIHNPQVIPGATPMQLRVFGVKDIEPEEVLSYELGYRSQLTDRFLFDITFFYSDYQKLRTFESKRPFFEPMPKPAHMVLPVYIDNKMDGETHGVELAVDMKLTDRWRVRTGYTFLDILLNPHKDSNDTRSEEAEGHAPRNQFTLRSLFNASSNLEIDAGVRHVDKLPTLGVDSYWTADARVALRLSDQWEVSVIARDLFDGSHAEWGADRDNRLPTEIERSVYGKIVWKF